MRFGLAGAFNTLPSTIADDQRLVNMYPEVVEGGGGRSGVKFHLIGTPGLKAKYSIDNGPSRGLYTIPGIYPVVDRCFAVNGSNLYELSQYFTATNIGAVYTADSAAYMTEDTGGNFLAVISGQRVYYLDLVSGVFTGPVKDTEGEELRAGSIISIAGYFLINVPGTRTMRFAGPGRTNIQNWDPLDAFEAEAEPGKVQRLMLLNRTVWALCDSTLQPFVVSSDADTPFEPLEAGVINQGCAAPDAAVLLDNSIFWHGRDPERGGIVSWRTVGYNAQRVSSLAMGHVFAKYKPADFALARGFAMVHEGHPIWQTSFLGPSINASWRYDAMLPPALAWYEVGCYNNRTAQYEAHKSITHTFAFGMHLVGDRGGQCCSGESTSCSNTATSVFDLGDMENSGNFSNRLSTYKVRIDPADFPNMTTARFRAVVWRGNAGTRTLELVDENGTSYLTKDIASSPTFVDEAISLPATAHSYSLRVTVSGGSSSDYNLQVFVPQIWIYQSTSKTAKYQIPLYVPAEIDQASSFSFGKSLWVKGGFDNIDNWVFEVIIDDSNTHTGTAKLHNDTDNTDVATHTIASGGGVYRVTLSDTAANFIDGKTFSLKMSSSLINILGAFLYCRTNASGTTCPKCEIYVRTSLMDCEVIANNKAYTHDSANFPGNVDKYYFDGTGVGPFSLKLKDLTAVADIATLTFTGGIGVATHKRSSAITLSNTHDYGEDMIDVPSHIVAAVT